MAKISFSLICVIAAFILIYDDHKLIAAKTISRRDVDMYTTKYDNIDVDKIVSSRRLMQNYANCLLDKGSCTAEGKELKHYLPDAIQTKCVKCSEKQKKIVGTVMAHLAKDYKDIFDELLAKYDPKGELRSQYEEDNVNEDYED